MSRSWATRRNWALTVSPGNARIHADLALRGNNLEGQVTMHQADVRLTPVLGSEYSRLISNENAAAAVGGIDHLEAAMQISGTLSAPQYELQSKLGEQLAAGLNQAFHNELRLRQEQLLSRADAEVDAQFAALQKELTAKQGKLLKQLEIGDEQLNDLKRELVSHVGNPGDLISRGRKLLFK